MSTHSWKEFKRSALGFNLHPNMLMPNGYTTYSTVHVKGEFDDERTPKAVHFDLEYACFWFINKVIKKLSITSYEQLETLVKLSWDEYIKQSQVSKTN